MKLFEFLDTKFVIVSDKIGKQKGVNYSVFDAGHLQALHSTIQGLRTAAKWVSIPLIFAEFFLVKLRLMTPPVSPLKKPNVTVDTTTNGVKPEADDSETVKFGMAPKA